MSALPSADEAGRHLPGIIRKTLGDYQVVAKLAQESSTTGKWRAKQTAKVVTVTAGAACGPLVFSVPASLAGYAFTVRKMAQVAWGVGARMAADQDSAEIDPEADLIAILALWAGATRDEVKRAVRAARPHAFRAGMAVMRLGTDSLGAELLKKLGRTIVKKINRKLLRTILTQKVGGFIPVAGVVMNGTAAWVLMHQMGKYAERYYADKFSTGGDYA